MNLKKAAAVILSVTMVLGMVSCKEDKEESSKSESKSNNGNVNTESVSESSSTSANEESIADSVESLVDSQEESLDDSESEVEYTVKGSIGDKYEYELNQIFSRSSYTSGAGLAFAQAIEGKEYATFFEIRGIHDDYQDISFDINDSSQWLDKCIKPFKDIFDRYPYYDIEDVEEAVFIKSKSEEKINGNNFIRFNGFFNDEEVGKMNFAGYITVYQNDEAQLIYKEADILGFMAVQKADVGDIDQLDEYSRHAAETLTFTE